MKYLSFLLANQRSTVRAQRWLKNLSLTTTAHISIQSTRISVRSNVHMIAYARSYLLEARPLVKAQCSCRICRVHPELGRICPLILQMLQACEEHPPPQSYSTMSPPSTQHTDPTIPPVIDGITHLIHFPKAKGSETAIRRNSYKILLRAIPRTFEPVSALFYTIGAKAPVIDERF